jgi:hypothetical protein
MVDVVQQLCIKSFEIKAENGDYWKAQQGKEYTTTKPKSNRRDVTVYSSFWVAVPKKHFVAIEKAT